MTRISGLVAGVPEYVGTSGRSNYSSFDRFYAIFLVFLVLSNAVASNLRPAGMGGGKYLVPHCGAIKPQTNQGVLLFLRCVCARSHPRTLEFCDITDDDVDDLASCFDDLGRETIVKM